MNDVASCQFVHLHVHSEYSLLDGSIKIKKLVQEAKRQGSFAVALTDHDAMHGVIEFYLECQKEGVRGILGYEANLVNWSSKTSGKTSHIVLLAENNTGYKNLTKLCSIANTSGKNRAGDDSFAITWDELTQYSQGLICLTSCQKGELARLVVAQQEDLALEFLELLRKTFGNDNVFIELIDNCLPGQRNLVVQLSQIAAKAKLPLVATGDVHYLYPQNKKTHLQLMAIKHKLHLEDIRAAEDGYEFHLSTPAEMQDKFADYPEALANTLSIAQRCHVVLDTKSIHMPDFKLRAEESAAEGMARLARDGLEKRREQIQKSLGGQLTEEVWQSYKERLEYEISVINKMNFAGYFLIVQDFINWAKERGIPVGPGRGSAAGSLVTYALRITNIDPLRFHLLFERFLNPERVSMPDIDTDFCQDRRDEVISYVYDRYGKSNVCQIVTFGRLMARNAIKSLTRINGWSFYDSNNFAKLIPEKPAGITLEAAHEQDERLRATVASDEKFKEVWDDAINIEGILNSLGIHAAGVIISDRPLDERCPVMESEGQLLTQIENKYAEKVGLIKFDFLGLKTLTVIDNAVKLINVRRNICLDIEVIDIEDLHVYKAISTAHLTGIFQLESPGMRKLIADLKPTCFSDIVAVNALFRPGPLGSGQVEDFVLRKHGKNAVEYQLPELQPILEDTYGVMVYQEQIQKIAVVLADYTLGEADLLRRAMGKKDKNEMSQQKTRFLQGAAKRGFDSRIADEVFELMAKFAEYGFNKSHSAAYGWVTYQTAYLKTYYPTEFMTAIMTCDLDNTEKIANYVRECKRLNIKILPPCVNNSCFEFSIPEESVIQFGLGAIKGLGKGVVEAIVAERKAGGAFQSVPEFIARVDPRKINRKVLESLIKAGALDDIAPNRAQTMANIDGWLRTISRELERQEAVGGGIFGSLDGFQSSKHSINNLLMGLVTKPHSPWAMLTRLEHEVASLGFYMSGHPADLYKEDLDYIAQVSLAEAALHLEPEDIPEFKRKTVRLAGVIVNFAERRSRENELFCILKLEDGSGDLEVAIYAKQYAALKRTFGVGNAVWVECKIRRGIEDGTVRGVCQAIGMLHEKRQSLAKQIIIRVRESFLQSPTSVLELKQLLDKYPGQVPLLLQASISQHRMQLNAKLVDHGISPTDDLMLQIEQTWPGEIEFRRCYHLEKA